MSEFNLSEKREGIKTNMRLALLGTGSCTEKYMNECVKAILNDIEEQDKEFIKRLKKMFPFVENENKVPLTAKGTNRRNKYWCKRIDNLIGEKFASNTKSEVKE